MTAPLPDKMPEFKPSWALPILAGAGGVILWQLVIGVVAASLDPGIAVVVSCCGCCSFPMVMGFMPALIAFSRDPGLRPGEGFSVSFIGVGAGVVVMLVVLYLGTSMAELRQGGADELRRTIDTMLQDQPELDLSDEEKENLIEFAGSVAPYMPLGIGMIAALLCGVGGMITVILLRSRMRPPQSMTSS